MTVLHAWMIAVRTRTLEPSLGNKFSNYVFNNIWKDLEYVVLAFGVRADNELPNCFQRPTL